MGSTKLIEWTLSMIFRSVWSRHTDTQTEIKLESLQPLKRDDENKRLTLVCGQSSLIGNWILPSLNLVKIEKQNCNNFVENFSIKRNSRRAVKTELFFIFKIIQSQSVNTSFANRFSLLPGGEHPATGWGNEFFSQIVHKQFDWKHFNV